MTQQSGWWLTFFDDFRDAFGLVSQRSTNAQVRFLIEKLHLKRGHKFLDCPCGIGRISIPLAKQGIKVTGVDITQSYLDELAVKAKRRHLTIPLQRRDMRRITFRNEFHAAANMWTSFGFFDKETDNLLTLRRMYQALRPGGRFLLHVINRDWIMAHYNPRDTFLAGDTVIHEVRGFDYATSTSVSTWTMTRGKRRVSHRVHIRMYSYHELIAMFEKVGFTDIEGYGTARGGPISLKSQMMFVVGRKPR